MAPSGAVAHAGLIGACGVSLPSTAVRAGGRVHPGCMSQWEHGTMTVISVTRQIGRTTASGEDVPNQEAGGLRHIMRALDDASADGWELVGAPSHVQTDKVAVTSYLLRRPKTDDGEPTIY
jgi:hypothetical protein